jgi:hypothetical protein
VHGISIDPERLKKKPGSLFRCTVPVNTEQFNAVWEVKGRYPEVEKW